MACVSPRPPSPGRRQASREPSHRQPEVIFELEPRDLVLIVINIGVEPDRREMLLGPLVGSWIVSAWARVRISG